MASSTSPPEYSNDDNGPAVNAIIWTFLSIAVVCVLLRCYVRGFLLKSFAADDALIVITLAILIAGDVVIANMVSAGMGRHLETLPDPMTSALQILKWNTIYQILNVCGALITKVSIGLFLLRLKDSRKLKLALGGVLVPLTVVTLILCFIVGLQCIPLKALWTPTIKGKCMNQETPLKVSYVQSGFAIITDLFLSGSPIAILWNVQINLRKKIAICALMSLGLMATVANALRNVFIPNLTAKDETYTIVPIVIVADLEFSLGVIAACIPTLMPLFKHNKSSSRASHKQYNRMSMPTYGSSRSRNPHRVQPSYNDDPEFAEVARTAFRADSNSSHTTESSIPLKPITDEDKITLSRSFAVERT